MWRLRGQCHYCGLPLFGHFFIWLQSIIWRFLGRPAVKGYRVVLIKKALAYFDQVGAPLLVEPLYREATPHATKHVMTRSQLVAAFYKAQDVSPWVVLRKAGAGDSNSSTSSESNGLR